MTTTAHIDADLISMVQAAIAANAGEITWDTGPTDVYSALEGQVRDLDRTIERLNLDEVAGPWLQDDGSRRSQDARSWWREALELLGERRDISRAMELIEVVLRAQDQAADEVTAECAEAGESAIEAIEAGDLDAALDAVETACRAERYHGGDDPTWGPVRDAIARAADGREEAE